MKFALIHNGIVGNFVFDINPAEFPDLHLVDITARDDVLIGDLYDEHADVFSHPAGPTPPTYEEQKAAYLDTVRDMREKILARLNGYGAGLLLNEPPALADEKALCSTIINGLLDITTITAVTDATDIETLTLAVKTEYARLVGMASIDMVKAFRKVDL